MTKRVRSLSLSSNYFLGKTDSQTYRIPNNPATQVALISDDDSIKQITINPFEFNDTQPNAAASAEFELKQKILCELLAKAEHEDGKKLRRSLATKLLTPISRPRQDYDIELEGVKYAVTLTHSIQKSDQDFFVLTHSEEDSEKYITTQENTKYARPNKDANSTIIRYKHKLVQKNGVYECVALTLAAKNVAEKAMVAKVLMPRLTPDNASRKQEIENEIYIQRKAGQIHTHENALIRGVDQQQKAIMIMEELPGENGYLTKFDNIISNVDRIDNALSTIESLEMIHQAGIIHRDIKSENIMIKDGRKTIFDYGGSRLMNDNNNPNKAFSPLFAPPEINSNPTEKSDLFSLTIAIAEMDFDADRNELLQDRNKALDIAIKTGNRITDVLSAPYDFSSIQYDGDEIAYLLMEVFHAGTAIYPADRPTLTWYKLFFQKLKEYELATDKQKPMQAVMAHAKENAYLFELLIQDFFEFGSEIQTIIFSLMENEHLVFFLDIFSAEIKATTAADIDKLENTIVKMILEMEHKNKGRAKLNVYFEKFAAYVKEMTIEKASICVKEIATNCLDEKQLILFAKHLYPELFAKCIANFWIHWPEIIKNYNNKGLCDFLLSINQQQQIQLWPKLDKKIQEQVFNTMNELDQLIFMSNIIGINENKLENLFLLLRKTSHIATKKIWSIPVGSYIYKKVHQLFTIEKNVNDDKYLLSIFEFLPSLIELNQVVELTVEQQQEITTYLVADVMAKDDATYSWIEKRQKLLLNLWEKIKAHSLLDAVFTAGMQNLEHVVNTDTEQKFYQQIAHIFCLSQAILKETDIIKQYNITKTKLTDIIEEAAINSYYKPRLFTQKLIQVAKCDNLDACRIQLEKITNNYADILSAYPKIMKTLKGIIDYCAKPAKENISPQLYQPVPDKAITSIIKICQIISENYFAEDILLQQLETEINTLEDGAFGKNLFKENMSQAIEFQQIEMCASQ